MKEQQFLLGTLSEANNKVLKNSPCMIGNVVYPISFLNNYLPIPE